MSNEDIAEIAGNPRATAGQRQRCCDFRLGQPPAAVRFRFDTVSNAKGHVLSQAQVLYYIEGKATTNASSDLHALRSFMYGGTIPDLCEYGTGNGEDHTKIPTSGEIGACFYYYSTCISQPMEARVRWRSDDVYEHWVPSRSSAMGTS